MFHMICKKFPPWRPAWSFSRNQDLRFLQIHPFSTCTKFIQKPDKSETDKRIDYLTKTCGMSTERAESVSRYLNFRTRQRPDSVISFFKNQGFTDTQIVRLISAFPLVLRLTPDKCLLPKIEFFRSLGLLNNDIGYIMSVASPVFGRSLEKHIIPLFRYISTLLQSHEKALLCIKRFSYILSIDLENDLIPNVDYFGEVGVPHENAVRLLGTYPSAISVRHEKFRKIVDEVKSMGFDPMKASFAVGVYAFGRNSESSWGKKVEIYKSFGISDAHLMEAFRRAPFCMMQSADKILKVIDFVVNRMGFEPSFFSKWPLVVCYSLEKRIIPRCNVYQALLAKDLVPKKFTLRLLLGSQERKFLLTFVEPFEPQLPGLLMMYKKNNSPVSIGLN